MSEQDQIFNYQINNMYNKDKHYNPHDITGVKGITPAQVRLLDEKKVQYRVNNEVYLRKHP